jgi:hypothetical protein
MDKEKLVCPKCNQEFEQPAKPNAAATSGEDAEGNDDPNCDPDDPEKKAYCCPMCGYQSPDLKTFVPLS